MPREIGQVLKTYRNKAKMTVKEISDILTQKGFKASESTIYSWENGNSQPTPGALLTMCSAYKIENVLDAFGYDGYNDDGSIRLNMYEIDLVEKYRALDAHGQEIVNSVIDIEAKRMKAELVEPKRKGEVIVLDFSSYKASAGTGNLLLDGETTKISVYSNNTTRKADMCISVTGDSMIPKYDDGDILLVRRQPAVYEGEIGIFLKDNKAFVKKKGAGKLISLNDKYPDVVDRGDDIITCYGKVIDKLRDEWKVNDLEYPDLEPKLISLKVAQESEEYKKED